MQLLNSSSLLALTALETGIRMLVQVGKEVVYVWYPLPVFFGCFFQGGQVSIPCDQKKNICWETRTWGDLLTGRSCISYVILVSSRRITVSHLPCLKIAHLPPNAYDFVM